MKRKERDKIINYATRLAVLVQGCSSANCRFADEDIKGRVGTANVCQCDQQAESLIQAIKSHIPKDDE